MLHTERTHSFYSMYQVLILYDSSHLSLCAATLLRVWAVG